MTVVSFSMAYRSFRGGSGRLDTHLDTPPSINRRHPNSCLAPDRALAHVRTPGGPTSPAQPRFRLTRSSPTPRLRPSLTQSNRRGTDPYARWWGRCGIARCPPIPILDPSRSLSFAFGTALPAPEADLRQCNQDRSVFHLFPTITPAIS